MKNQCGPANPARFYYGVDVDSLSATDFAWEDVHSTQTSWADGDYAPIVIWDAPTGSPTEPQRPELTFGSE